MTWTWSNQRFSTTTTLPSDSMFVLSDEMRLMLGLVDLSSIEDIERYLAS